VIGVSNAADPALMRSRPCRFAAYRSTTGGPGKVPTCGWPGKARTGEAWPGHRSITSTAVYTALAPNRLKISGESELLPTGSKMILPATRLALAFGALQGEQRWAIANPASATVRRRIGSSSPRLAAATISAAMSSRTTSGWPVKAYPVDSGSATCCALNDRIRPVAGTTIDGQRAFAFAISESVF